ncbi:MAG: putative phosphoesterase [Bacteroidetes bacterium]|nr:putative phosphoesterase [Bacteroidota bacterium]
MKEGYLELKIEDESFLLLPQRAIYRPSNNQLILSDVHLGKATHFRKQGLAISQESKLKDIDKLHFLIDKWNPQSILFLGDLFHSDYNKEWLWFKSLLLHYPQHNFILIEGNHDILDNDQYNSPNLLKAETLEEENFIFSHYPLNYNKKLNIHGHIHPGIMISGMAKQFEKLPCFHLTKTHLTLPAFGYLTGLQILEQNTTDKYFLVTGNRVIHYKK